MKIHSDRAERRPRHRGHEVAFRAPDDDLQILAAVQEGLGDERAGEYEHVDEKEQPDQQESRAHPVPADVRVKTVGVCHGPFLRRVPAR